MLLLALAVAQASAPTFTLEAARAMSKPALVQAILGLAHEPVADVVIHPIGMEPPTKSLREITLIGAPIDAPDRKGWCRRVDRTVTFAAADKATNPYVTAVPVHVEKIDDRTSYRVARGLCSDSHATFFTVWPNRRDEQFQLFDRLKAARALAGGNRPLPFTIRCKDEDGGSSSTFGGDRCVKKQGRTLLAKLPIDHIYNLSPSGESQIYSTNRPLRRVRRDGEVGMFDDTLAIDVTITEEGDRITAITIKRHIPYPF